MSCFHCCLPALCLNIPSPGPPCHTRCLRMYLFSLFWVSLFSPFFLFYVFLQDQLNGLKLFMKTPAYRAMPFLSPLNSQSSWLLFTWQLLAMLLTYTSPRYKEQWDIALMAWQRGLIECLIHIHFCLLSAHDGVVFIPFDPVNEQISCSHRKFITKHQR